MATNYATEPKVWNSTLDSTEETERLCPRCRGRYPQIDACVECEGDGTVFITQR